MLHKSYNLLNFISRKNMLIPKQTLRSVLLSQFFKYGSSANSKPIDMSFNYFQVEKEVRPPLVIMHGLLGSKRNWGSLGMAFTKQTTPKRGVYVVDARNHGDSAHSLDHTYKIIAEDIKKFLSTQNIAKASLLGHSMGGRAMMYFALIYPDLVDKLIVADMSPISKNNDLSSIPTILKILLSVDMPRNVPEAPGRTKVDEQLAVHISDKNLRMFLETNLVPGNKGKFVWKANVQCLLDNYDNINSFPHEQRSFAGPVLFISGGQSDYVKKQDHPEILKIFPNADFHVINKAGHWLHADNPREFMSVCVTFLNKD